MTEDCHTDPAECRASRAVERRGRIAEAARKLFMEKGFHGTGVAQISAESGVKVGQIYRDFASKEEIVAEIVQTHVSLFLDEDGLHDAVRRQDAHAARRWLSRFLSEDRREDDHAGEDCSIFAEIHAEASRNARIAAIVRDTDARVRGNIATALEVLAPGPGLSSQRMMLARVIVSLTHGLWHRLITDPDAPQAALATFAARMIEPEIDALVAAGARARCVGAPSGPA